MDILLYLYSQEQPTAGHILHSCSTEFCCRRKPPPPQHTPHSLSTPHVIRAPCSMFHVQHMWRLETRFPPLPALPSHPTKLISKPSRNQLRNTKFVSRKLPHGQVRHPEAHRLRLCARARAERTPVFPVWNTRVCGSGGGSRVDITSLSRSDLLKNRKFEN